MTLCCAAGTAAPLVWSPEGVRLDGEVVSKQYAFDASALPYAAESGVGTIQTSYIAVGAEDAPPMLLVHGFGASAFHWRDNVNALAAGGFGASEKPVMDYDGDLWVQHCAAFLEDVAGCGNGKQAVVAGNSIGGYTALALGAKRP